MPALVVVGTQWGDEGKGKITDALAASAQAVVRWQGGHNAGHTVMAGGHEVVLHLLPVGALHEETHCFIGHGAVVSPEVLLQELDGLRDQGFSVTDRLWVSAACPLLLASHKSLDQARELHAGHARIGTTQRGVGPAYEDKAARRGLRLEDLFRKDFPEKLEALVDYHNFLLVRRYDAAPLDLGQLLEQNLKAAERVRPMVVKDVPLRLNDAHDRGELILLEGSQGSLLDIDTGTYPFVTSSNTVAGSVCVGSGLGLRKIDYILGVAKAYATRVGAGPFPTELHDEDARTLSTRGKEFGATTGRPRRCGWLDLEALRQAVRLNSIDGLCLTKLDVLDGMKSIKLCDGYESESTDVNAESRPVYRELPGWNGPVRGARSVEELPPEARAYIDQIEEFVGVPVALLSTGPERENRICLDPRLPLSPQGVGGACSQQAEPSASTG